MNQHHFTALIQLKNAVPLFFSEEESRGVFGSCLFSEQLFDWYYFLHILQVQAPQVSNWRAHVVHRKHLRYQLETSVERTAQHFSTWYILILMFVSFLRIKLNPLCYLSVFSLSGSLHCDLRGMLDSAVETRGVARSLAEKGYAVC